MALAHEKFTLTVKLLDVGRKSTSKEYDLIAEDAEEAATAADALLSDLNGVTDLTITGYSINDVWADSAAVAPTILTAKRTNVLELVVQLSSSPLKTARLKIPGPLDSLFVGVAGTANYNVAKLDAALLLAYTDNFRAGATPTATISDGENMANAGGHIRGFRVTQSSGFKNPG